MTNLLWGRANTLLSNAVSTLDRNPDLRKALSDAANHSLVHLRFCSVPPEVAPELQRAMGLLTSVEAAHKSDGSFLTSALMLSDEEATWCAKAIRNVQARVRILFTS